MPYNNWNGLQIVTPPAQALVSVEDAKAHMRVFSGPDDALVAGYIGAATRICEEQTRRAFMPQTWRLSLNQFPGRTPLAGYQASSNPAHWLKYRFFEIPKPPLQSIASFYYYDTNNNQYAMQVGYDNSAGNYYLNTDAEPGRVELPFAGVWPTTVLLPADGILVTFTCGYAAYSLTVNVDVNGVATLPATSPPGVFDANLFGTWVTLSAMVGSPPSTQTVSCAVASVAGASLQLIPPSPNPLTFPLTGATLTGNCVPMPLRSAVLFLAAHLYENREPVVTGRGEVAVEIPFTVDTMLNQYKIYGT